MDWMVNCGDPDVTLALYQDDWSVPTLGLKGQRTGGEHRRLHRRLLQIIEMDLSKMDKLLRKDTFCQSMMSNNEESVSVLTRWQLITLLELWRQLQSSKMARGGPGDVYSVHHCRCELDLKASQ